MDARPPLPGSGEIPAGFPYHGRPMRWDALTGAIGPPPTLEPPMFPYSTVLVGCLALITLPLAALEINDQFRIEGVLAAAGQCQRLSGGTDTPDSCHSAAPFQPDLTYQPTPQDELFLKLGFAAGNGLNPVSPFGMAPWAADLKDDVHHINGRNRSYLLEAWYAHSFPLASDSTLKVTTGLIDSTDYLDTNAYANDEYGQFMNGVFVNTPSDALPGYDWGGVLVWKYQDWTFSALGMNVGENDAGNNYNFYGVEADYHLETPLGEGNYRVLYSGTSSAYPSPAGTRLERLQALSLSCDQALGEVVGAFVRLGWQSEDAAVSLRAFYSGGLNLSGTAWGRGSDNIGIGYARLRGGNTDFSRGGVYETYYRLSMDEHLALTADLQYLTERYQGADDPKGWIGGLRLTVTF